MDKTTYSDISCDLYLGSAQSEVELKYPNILRVNESVKNSTLCRFDCCKHYFSDISTSNGGTLASSPEKRAGPSSGLRSVWGAFLLDLICITNGQKTIPIRT